MARSRRCNRLPGVSSFPRPQPAISRLIDSSLVSARAGMSDGEATRRMAEDMREAAYREGGLTEHGLELLGYSAKQIADLVKPARLLANQQAAMT